MSRLTRRWHALRHRRLQSFLAAAAIASAVALPVVLLSVGGGVAQHEIHALQNAGFQVTVSAPGVHGVQGAHALAAAIDAIPNVSVASPVLSVSLDSFPRAGAVTPVLAEGVIPQAFEAALSPEEQGLFHRPLPFSEPTDRVHFDNGSYAGRPSLEVMVAGPLATAEGLRVGDSMVLSPTSDENAGTPFTIVGTFATPRSSIGPTAAFAVVVPLSDLQELTGLGRTGPNGTLLDAADTLQVALAGAAATDPVAIRAAADAIAHMVPYYGVGALTDEAQQLAESAAVLTGFYLALSSAGLIVGLVFVALVLVRRVETERRLIGIRRALGIPAVQIASDWLANGAVLTGSGVAAGTVSGWLIVLSLARFGSGSVATAAQLALFDPVTIGLLALSVLGLGALASLVATRAALRLPIPEALR